MSDRISAKRHFIELLEKILPEGGVHSIGGSVTFTLQTDTAIREELKEVDDAIRKAMENERVCSVHRTPGFLYRSEEITINFGHVGSLPR